MVSIAHQLTVLRESLNRTVLPHRLISFDVVESIAVQNKIAAIDPTLAAFWFFIKLSDVVAQRTRFFRNEPGNGPSSRSPAFRETYEILAGL